MMNPRAVVARANRRLRKRFVLVISDQGKYGSNTVNPLPPRRFVGALTDRRIDLFIRNVRDFTRLVCRITPPLNALTVKAIRVNITRNSMRHALQLIPRANRRQIVTKRATNGKNIMAHLAMLRVRRFRAFQGFMLRVIAIRPTLTFRRLFSFTHAVLNGCINNQATPMVIHASASTLAYQYFRSSMKDGLYVMERMDPRRHVTLRLYLHVELRPMIFPRQGKAICRLVPSNFFR